MQETSATSVNQVVPNHEHISNNIVEQQLSSIDEQHKMKGAGCTKTGTSVLKPEPVVFLEMLQKIQSQRRRWDRALKIY